MTVEGRENADTNMESNQLNFTEHRKGEHCPKHVPLRQGRKHWILNGVEKCLALGLV